MKKYGQEVKILVKNGASTGEYGCNAFIQPLRYKNKMYLEGIISEIGYVDEGHYLYIGPSIYILSKMPPDTEIHMGTEKFFIKRTEVVRANEVNIYVWAVLQALRDGDTL